MDRPPVETRLVCGFLDAGKTTYIQDCIRSDYFHKYGSTLILATESGEAEYDADALLAYRAKAVYWEDSEDLAAFCLRQLEEHEPDRVYVELNAMREGAMSQLPPDLRITAVTTLVDFSTLDLYLKNFRTQLSEMIRTSETVIFRGCASKELLAPYSQVFRLLNRRAVYLRQDPMGYHERAFDIFVPFDLARDELEIDKDGFLPFFLDASEHPEHYEGKTLRFSSPLEVRGVIAGRTVMTCCMADIQFMGFPLEQAEERKGWIRLTATGGVASDTYGGKRLLLKPLELAPGKPPEELILNAI